MNQKLLLIVSLLLLSGCSLFWSGPSSVVKNLISAAEGEDVDAMVALWGSKAIEEQGAAVIRENARRFVDIERKAKEYGEVLEIKDLHETIEGDRARVFFIYRNAKGGDAAPMGFALLKENGKWKLYRSIGGEEDKPFDSSFAPRKSPTQMASPQPNASPMEMISPVPPSPADSRHTATNSNASSSAAATNAAPISGGVLNAKATSLPQPDYPAAARAAKASGTVVVQVLVDERGDVITAAAVSGHPLLRSAAEQAARLARFKPTMEGGKPVKVKGTVTYQFSAP